MNETPTIDQPVRVVAKIDGLRRAGRRHRGDIVHPAGTFSQAELDALVAEPGLEVTVGAEAEADEGTEPDLVAPEQKASHADAAPADDVDPDQPEGLDEAEAREALQALNADDAIFAVGKCDDAELLGLMRAGEVDGKNRKTVLAAIDARAAELVDGGQA